MMHKKLLKYYKTTKRALAIAALVAVCGCGSFSLYNPDRGEILAQVGDSTLYEGDINFQIKGIAQKDSLEKINLYIKQWVNDQIELQQALQSLGDYQDVIDQKVKEYRKSLLRYYFQVGYVSQNIDTLVTQKQIAEYYASHKANFRLAGPLVKVRIARIPAQLRQSNTLRELFQSTKESDLSDFKELCDKNNYRLNDLTQQWTPFSEVLMMIPFSNTDFDSFLRSKKYYEVQDDQYQYMMVVVDKLFSGDLSPREMVEKEIRQILLRERREELLGNFKDSLYNQALSQGLVQIKGENPISDSSVINTPTDSTAQTTGVDKSN